MSDWRTKPLEELCDPSRSIAYGIVQPGKPVIGGVPIVRVNNFKSSGLDLSEVICVDQSIEQKYRRSRPRPSDVLVTLVGSIGQVALAPPAIVGWNLARAVGLVPMADHHHAEWIAYSIRNRDAQAFINQHANTTVQATFNLKDLAKLPIPYPDRITRETIIGILSVLDNKIELNRRMNATLEAMAQAIFRDWFVDFGPVHRKAGGETDPVAILGGLIPDPEKAAPTAALFPDSFGDDGLPEGWSNEPLIDQAEWINGAAYKKMHFVDPAKGMPVIKIAELKNGVTAQTKFTNTDLGEKYRIDDRDLLFSWSGNPDTSIDTFLWSGGPAWLNQHIFAVRNNGKRQASYLFVLLKNLKPEFTRIATDKQTTGLGHVTKADMRRLMICVATDRIVDQFTNLIAPMFDRILSSTFECRSLAETRDYLLPRLMSGQVRVVNDEEIAA